MSVFLFETYVKEPSTLTFAEMIPLIQPFMLTVENKNLFSTVTDPVVADLNLDPIDPIILSPDPDPGPGLMLSPNHTNDSLFWCLYILHFGYNDYIQVSRNYGVRSLEVKKQVGEWLTKHPYAMKQTNYKITKASIQEIMSECMTCQKETSMLTILAILAFFKINIFLINATENCLLECIGNVDEGSTYLIKKDKQSKYFIVGDPLTENEKNQWKEKCVCLSHYEKPLQTISHYKVDDLLSIAQKMDIKLTKKYKKPELYVLIWNECLWK